MKNPVTLVSSRCIENKFGDLPDGRKVKEFILSNENGLSVSVLNYGGIIRSIKAPDKNGRPGEIILGYDNLSDYLSDSAYLGAVIGRYANRIAKSYFYLDGTRYELTKNDGENTLHGGKIGFSKILWDGALQENDNNVGLTLRYISRDGDQGFPGELDCTVVYTLNNLNELTVEFKAGTTLNTVVSLTLHPYFNLSNNPENTIEDHYVKIRAHKYLPIGQDTIPTGIMADVTGTPFDFTKPERVGAHIGKEDEQLRIANGYDHCFVVDKEENQIVEMATVFSEDSGRILKIFSNAPGIQLYTSNFLHRQVCANGIKPFRKWQALCLEPQQFPNAPNEPLFPSPVLRPGELYHHKIVYKFGILNSNDS